MANKFGARSVEVDGYRFASKAEASRYEELRMMQMAGEISGLECHPRFALFAIKISLEDRERALGGRRKFNPHGYGKRVGAYTADFAYTAKDGGYIVEDVKGGEATSTEAYRLRKKLVEATYGLTVTEVLR